MMFELGHEGHWKLLVGLGGYVILLWRIYLRGQNCSGLFEEWRRGAMVTLSTEVAEGMERVDRCQK